MSANDILKKSIALLGYTDSEGGENLDTRTKTRAIPIINQVYSDLFYPSYPGVDFVPITKLTDTINLPERILNEVMPYGVASFIAQSESDGDNQQLFVMLYNQKRKLLNTIGEIEDGMGV